MMQASVRVQVQGGEWLQLGHRELLAEGGEGRVYVRGDRAYKLYHDPARVIPAAKLRELSVLDYPAVIRPRTLLLDTRQRPVGYSMVRVPEATPLVRLFAQQFQRQQAITSDQLLALCQAMATVVRLVHGQGCLLVDANELNWLVLAPGYREVAVIDVDSFQTPHFPATAQSPNIHDYQQSGFSEASDWFALAVMVCQLWVGVHPYKGRHPDFPPHDLAGRMRAGVSLFDPAVSLPPSARDPAQIPAPWQDWLRALLVGGERWPAPHGGERVSPSPRVVSHPLVQEGGAVSLEALERYGQAIEGVDCILGHRLVHTAEQLWVDGVGLDRPAGAGVALLPEGAEHPLWARLVDGQLVLVSLRDGRAWPGGIAARACFSVEGRLYLLAREQLLEVQCRWLGERWRALVVANWSILPEATRLGEGFLFQSVFGQTRLLVPFRPGGLAQLVVPALSGHRLLGGRWAAGVAVLVGSRNGRLDRFVLRFAKDHRHYRLDLTEDIPSPSWNLAVLDSGVAVLVGEALEVFHGDPGKHGRRQLPAGECADLSLVADGHRLLGYRAGQLYRLGLVA